MNIRERLEAFWSGEKPDRIPYTIYQNEWRHTSSDKDWLPMFEKGLGVTWHVPTVLEKRTNAERKAAAWLEKGHEYVRETVITPVGEIYCIKEDGWMQKYWLESAEDYRVMAYLAKHTSLEADYDRFSRFEKDFPDYAVPLVAAGRTPLQTILVDYVGLENFSYHLYDYEDELLELYEAMLNIYDRRIEIIAGGPGRFVSMLENFTAESLGPQRFAKFHVPVYEKYYPILHGSGKIIGNHYDGKLSSCSKLIAGAPIDLIESLTPPPEGDMTLSEARKIWPDKLFWSNINTANYYLPHKELKELVYDLVGQAAPDGRRLAFEVSEQYPGNWKESMPVILETLNEIIL